jgi:hypothetical protein
MGGDSIWMWSSGGNIFCDKWPVVLFYVLFVSIVLFCALFVCKCVLYYCHQLLNPIAVNKYMIFLKNNIERPRKT